jgi:protoheme IX farnesyltransferase
MVNDHLIASKHMKWCLLLNGLSWFGSASQFEPELKIVGSISGLLSLYFWNYKSIKRFELDPIANV